MSQEGGTGRQCPRPLLGSSVIGFGNGETLRNIEKTQLQGSGGDRVVTGLRSGWELEVYVDNT